MGTWDLRSLSCIQPRCGWSWQTHQAAAEWRSTLHQRTPCRRRPRMSRCVGQGWHGTHHSSSPPAHCSQSSPAGQPCLQAGESCYAVGRNLIYNYVFRNSSAQSGDHYGIEPYLRVEYSKRNGIKKSVLRGEEVPINFSAILFKHKTTSTSAPKQKTWPEHSGRSFLMYSVCRAHEASGSPTWRLNERVKAAIVCVLSLVLHYRTVSFASSSSSSSAYLFLNHLLLSPMLHYGPLTPTPIWRPLSVCIWSLKGTDFSETWECVKLD